YRVTLRAASLFLPRRHVTSYFKSRANHTVRALRRPRSRNERAQTLPMRLRRDRSPGFAVPLPHRFGILPFIEFQGQLLLEALHIVARDNPVLIEHALTSFRQKRAARMPVERSYSRVWMRNESSNASREAGNSSSTPPDAVMRPPSMSTTRSAR